MTQLSEEQQSQTEIIPNGFRDLSTTWLCMALDYQKAARRFLDHGDRERSVIENAKAEMLAWCHKKISAPVEPHSQQKNT